MSTWAMQALQYLGYGIELSLVVALGLKGRWRGQKALAAYVFAFFCSDAVIRPTTLYEFGLQSLVYRYVYWFTDVLLVLGAFLLIAHFFKRALAAHPALWAKSRTLLVFVFAIVAIISFAFLSDNRSDVLASFISGFQQNLYFVCLVLNTLLYVIIHQMDCADDDLAILVCGLGVQFAGPAASFALIHLTMDAPSFIRVAYLVGPACSLGMLLSWLYVVTRKAPERAPRLAATRLGMSDMAGAVLPATK